MKNHFDASSLDSLGRNEEALDTYRSDLDVFELVKVPNHCNYNAFKKAYLQYMVKNHQDRGGDVKVNQFLNGAIAYLRRTSNGSITTS